MKRLPIIYAKDLSGRDYWRSLGEREGSPEFRASLAREFPEGASELPEELKQEVEATGPDGGKVDVTRRGFLGVMGAAAALASFAGCRRPEEKIIPYARPPEEIIPGKPLYYATAMPFYGTTIGLLVESHEGRPTKIEGNPAHPDSRGATTPYIQATVLDMYDPDRSATPLQKNAGRSWDEAIVALRELGKTLAANGGKSLAIISDYHRSPTLELALTDLKKAMPSAQIVRYEPFGASNGRAGTKIAFGKPMDAVHELGKAKVIVSLDADLFHAETSPIKASRGWAEGREIPEGEGKKPDLNRLYVAESAYSITGASADHRLRVPSGQVSQIAAALADVSKEASSAGVAGVAGSLPEKAKKWVAAVLKDLVTRAPGTTLVVAGQKQPPAVHALVALINQALGNIGQTVRYVPAFNEGPEGASAMVELGKSIASKAVDTVIVLAGNPAFDAPADANMATGLAGVTTLHLGSHVDETGALAAWHIPKAHILEGWNDLVAEDGTYSVVQPLIAPLYGGKTEAELVRVLLNQPAKGHDLVRATAAMVLGEADFEKKWRRLLHSGAMELAEAKVEAPTLAIADVLASAKSIAAPQGFEIVFYPDFHAWDGRFANNGWLQELPDSMTKLTWTNVAWLSPNTAKELGVADGDMVNVTVNGATAKLPAAIVPGQAEKSVAVMCGSGRRTTGRVGTKVGFDTYPLRKAGGFDFASGTVAKAGEVYAVARTQEHFATEGRPFVREGTVAEFIKNPEFVKEMVEEGPPLESLWSPIEYTGHRWGLTINLNTCTGCMTCMIACQAENNIPVVGEDGVRRSRSMHWIRVDRYFEGTAEEPRAIVQPLPCQQCENAPCESVCPVGATTHSPEGLNDMAYNRCIGTRYCANNCPFKVRRFNFFNYNTDVPEQRKMQFNPDVTVRFRGVMEKCTFCVQRINKAKIAAKKEGSDRVKDGVIVTACQQACPTGAITFGDLADEKSAVAKSQKHPVAYKLLEELNIHPRVSYLAKIKNPNPELGES